MPKIFGAALLTLALAAAPAAAAVTGTAAQPGQIPGETTGRYIVTLQDAPRPAAPTRR
ncbi:hypothetical protein ACIOWI_01170 [Streptomyces sp. NPDC087659]|uniref:hypothetical protein n=1 Tax=Streptomyces sp. NPDC087659 TaxID=3365801 RepID=UPI00381B257F